MKKLCAALIGLLLASAAQAQSVSWPPPAGTIAFLCVYTTVPPTLVTTNVGFVQCDSSGRILTANTPSGTQDVNVAKINGITPLMGNGGTGTGSPRVTIASDNTAFSVNATLSAETTKVIGTVNQGTSPWVVSNGGTFAVQAASTQSGTWTVQPGNTPNTTPWLITNTPSSASGAGLTPTTTGALAANSVVKASAGNLYSFEVSADSTLSAAAWWIMIYDATSAPVDGAVTPKKCYAMSSGTTSASYGWNSPVVFATGITIGVSTTGCFTKTASTHAFISGDAQ